VTLSLLSLIGPNAWGFFVASLPGSGHASAGFGG
jgi:hypothetical protein